MDKIESSYFKILNEIDKCYEVREKAFDGKVILIFSPINMFMVDRIFSRINLSTSKVYLVARKSNYEELNEKYGRDVKLIGWNESYSDKMIDCIFSDIEEEYIEDFIFTSEKKCCIRDMNVYSIANELRMSKGMKNFYIFNTSGIIYRNMEIERTIDLLMLYNDIDSIIARYYELMEN